MKLYDKLRGDHLHYHPPLQILIYVHAADDCDVRRWRSDSGRPSDVSSRACAGAWSTSASVGRRVSSAVNRRTGRSCAVPRRAARVSTALNAGKMYTSVSLSIRVCVCVGRK